VSRDPLIILDGAHNPGRGEGAGAATAAAAVCGQAGGDGFRAMRIRAFTEISSILFPLADELICTAAGQAQALPPGGDAGDDAAPERADGGDERRGVGAAARLRCAADYWLAYLVGEARALLVS
jgi:hypothetical protein